MDLLESPTFTPQILILQTVLEEIRHRSIPLFHRLKALMSDGEKRVYMFYNEFHE